MKYASNNIRNILIAGHAGSGKTTPKEGMNVELDKAIRLYDFITMGELVAYDALNRNESCGGHFREEYQTEEGEAKRDDENYFYVACWEYQGSDAKRTGIAERTSGIRSNQGTDS